MTSILGTLPAEILLAILFHLPILDYYSLKLAGCRRITDVVRDVTARLPQQKYTQELQAEDARRMDFRPGFTRTTMEIMIARGQSTLVLRYLRKYRTRTRSGSDEADETRGRWEYHEREKRVFQTALHWAVYYGSGEIVRLLLDVGRMADARVGNVGWTALHLAAIHGKTQMVRLILTDGRIDLDALDTRGRTPLQLAVENHREEVIQLLRATGAASSIDDVLEKHQKQWVKRLGGNVKMRSKLPVAIMRKPYMSKEAKDYYGSRSRMDGATLTPLRNYLLLRGRGLGSMESELMENAIISGGPAIVSTLLDDGWGVNDRVSCQHSTALCLAVCLEKHSIAKLLLERGAHPTVCFIKAATMEKTLLQSCLNVSPFYLNIPAPIGNTLLHVAAFRGDLLMAKFLVEADADLKARNDKHKVTSLFSLCEGAQDYKPTGCLRSLLQVGGAYINTQDNSRDTPAYDPAASDKIPFLTVLLEHWTGPALKSYARVCPFLVAVTEEADELLLDTGSVDINTHDTNQGRTKLHLTLAHWVGPEYRGHRTRVTQILLHRGADVNIKKKSRPRAMTNGISPTTPFQLARRDNWDVVAEFIEHGANLNTKDVNSRSSSFFEKETLGPLKVLFEHGSGDPHYCVKDGPTFLHALFRRGPPIRKSLKLDMLKILLVDYKLDANALDEDGLTPLMHVNAVRGEYSKHMALLLKHGASVDARDSHGCTLLHRMYMASHTPSTDMAELLLDHGLDVNTRDNDGRTALYLATRWRYQFGVKLLLNRGADVNIRDCQGSMPLHYAAANGMS